jgi:hypothetical protein
VCCDDVSGVFARRRRVRERERERTLVFMVVLFFFFFWSLVWYYFCFESTFFIFD